MKCPVCGATNEAGAAFCYQCGSRLERTDTSFPPVTGQTVDLSRGAPKAEETGRARGTTDNLLTADERDTTGDLAPLPQPAQYPAPAPVEPVLERHRARTYAEPPSLPLSPSVVDSASSAARVYQVPAAPSARPYIVGPVTAMTRTSTLATIALILGALSWIVIPIIGGIGAIITGHMARKEIRRSGGQISGDGLALAGLVLGYLNVGLAGLAVIGFCLLVPLLRLAS